MADPRWGLDGDQLRLPREGESVVPRDLRRVLGRRRRSRRVLENQPPFALYERARSAVPTAAVLDVALDAPAFAAPLAAAAARFGYAWV